MQIQIKKIKELKNKVEISLTAELRRPIEQRDEFTDYLDGQLNAYNKVLILFNMKFKD